MIADKKRKILEKHICENSLIILVGKSEAIRNGDIYYPFRQDSDFLLLTGLNVPDLLLVGYKKNDIIEWVLYSEPISDKEKLWGTARFDYSELSRCSGIHDIRVMRQSTEDIRRYLSTMNTIYIRDTLSYDEEKKLLRKFQLGRYSEKIQSLSPILANLRIIKTEEEVDCMRKAIDITHAAYQGLEKNIKPGMFEYEVEAIIAGVFRSHNVIEAYPTIVASGKNSCTLHYVRHERKIEPGDHVLIDFGAEYRGYSADITRVFFTGEKNARQKAVYSAVEEVKNYAEGLIRPGVRKLDYEHDVRRFMNEALVKLGLIEPREIDNEFLSRKYYPHSTSHFLGLDTHDVGNRDEVLEEGMVLTCEPGIYIPEEGIGIRLEDDILVTENGCENLSKNIPFIL